ncbi:MAG: TonB-dependent receptor, partial [Acidobacteria bacterium]|nr:TonB-dependent receptor [Acidobacteriota bacterium]
GRYRAPNLALGPYEVQAELAGFQTGVRSGIKLTVGREAIVDFTLKVGEISERITVVGEAPLVDTTTASVSALVDEKRVVDLPLNNRDLSQLVLLQPGLVLMPTEGTHNDGFGKSISVAGMRFNQNLYLLDGTTVNDQSGNPGGASGAFTGVETVKEFSVITNNYSAEYRNAAGGIINSVTKSGTNELHGSVFEFLRNDNLDGRNFFDDEKPEFKRNQFGFSVGGPIVKNKTFAFGSYEATREIVGVTRFFQVPTAAARAGILPGRTVQVAEAVKPYLALYPLPNGSDLGGGVAEFIAPIQTDTEVDFFTLKMDHVFSEKDSLSGTYTFDDSSKVSPHRVPGVLNVKASARKQILALRLQRVFSASLLNEVRLGFSRTLPSESYVPVTPRPELAFVPGQETLGNLGVRGLSTLSQRDTIEGYFQNTYSLADSMSFIRGRHSVKLGADIQKIQLHAATDSFGRGTYSFDSLADFLVADPAEFRAALPGHNDPLRTFDQWLLGFYVQDNYRVRPSLTLNLGLRYEFVTVPREKHGREANLRRFLDPSVTVGPIFDNPTLKSFAPRVGFAWDPSGTGRTSIRAGFGVFYDQPMTYQIRTTSANIAPFYQTGTLERRGALRIAFPNALQLQSNLMAGSLEIRGFTHEVSPTYIYRYSLTVQRQFGSDWVLAGGYTGSRAAHLWRQTLPNLGPWQILPDGRKFFPVNRTRLNPNFGQIRYQSSDGNSYYHGLQLGLDKRLSQGLQFQASYTLSKSIDDASAATGASFLAGNNERAIYFWDRHLFRGLSSFDTRHHLMLNYIYELPFGSGGPRLRSMLVGGWQLGGIVFINAGYPQSVIGGNTRAQRDRMIDTGGLRP